MLYHGSNYRIENELEPRLSFAYQKLVYATEDYFYALVRAGRFNMEEVKIREDYNGKDKPFSLVELIPGAFEQAFNTQGYIYEVDDELFTYYDLEYVTDRPVKIRNTIVIRNVWDEILKNAEHYELIFYGEDEEYWKTVRGGKEGYLERRANRIRKWKEAMS